MADHNKKTLANEYCLCRKIPHSWNYRDEQLVIGRQDIGYDIIFSIYNIPYAEIATTIDSMCEYDEFGHFVGLKR